MPVRTPDVLLPTQAAGRLLCGREDRPAALGESQLLVHRGGFRVRVQPLPRREWQVRAVSGRGTSGYRRGGAVLGCGFGRILVRTHQRSQGTLLIVQRGSTTGSGHGACVCEQSCWAWIFVVGNGDPVSVWAGRVGGVLVGQEAVDGCGRKDSVAGWFESAVCARLGAGAESGIGAAICAGGGKCGAGEVARGGVGARAVCAQPSIAQTRAYGGYRHLSTDEDAAILRDYEEDELDR